MKYSKIINDSTYMSLLWKYEEGKLPSILFAPLFQFLINKGHVWNLQGFHGALAMDLIEEGICVFGVIPIRSVYGGYFPSRFQIEADAPGSLEYQRKQGYDLIRI